MKKLLLTLLCILAFAGAKAQCSYTLEMTDSWGDGWAGNTMDVLVNGTVVLNDVTEPGGGGGGTPSTTLLTFSVNTGDDVTVIWSGAGTGFPNYEEECSYRILNSSGVAVATVDPTTDGSGDITTGTITANCPACLTPSALAANTFTAGGNANISWTAAAGAITYNYEIQPVGTAQGTAGPIVANTSTATTSATVNAAFVSGNQYTLYVRTVCSGGNSLYVSINFTFNPAPANDTCAGVIDLDTVTSPVNGTTVGAFKDFNNDCLSVNPAAPDVVYSITVANGATLSIGQTVNNFDSVIRLAYGGSCPGTTLIQCRDDSDTATETWENTTGSSQEVYFVVSAYQTESGTFTLAYSVTAPPACGDATALLAGTFTPGGATISWSPGFSAVSHNYEIQPVGVAQGTAGAVVANTNTAANTATVSGAFVSGTQYTLYVRSNCGGTMGNYVSKNFTFVLPPNNDECTAAVGLTVNADYSCAVTTAGTNVGATASAQTDDVIGTPNDDVWYSFTATAIAHRISLLNVVASSGGSTDMAMGLYSGDCATLTKVGDSDPNTYNATGLTIGTLYKVRVYSWSGTSPVRFNFNICIGTPPAPPANDDCAGAIALTVNAIGSCASTITTNHGGATDSLATYSCDTTAPGTNIDSWYTFVAPASGSITFTFANGTQAGTPKMAIFDACGGVESFCSTTNNIKVASGLTAGATYTMSAWYDSFNVKGTFTICASISAPPPVNDDCANATSIAVGQTIEQNSTSSTATPEGIGCALGNNGLWYTFVGTGEMVTVTSGASFDHEIAVASGTCGVFANVVCKDSSSGSIETTTFATTLATTYYIYIAHWSAGNTTVGPIYVTLTGEDNIWDGMVWSKGTPPTTSQTAVIDGTYNTGTDGNIDASSMVINTGNDVTVSAGSFVRTAGDIDVNGTGTLVVEHEGSVVQDFDTALTFAATNNITVQKTTPLLNNRDFMILGSPMTAETRSGAHGNNIIFRNHITGNFVPNQDVENEYPMAENFADDNGNNWLDYNGVMNPGEGYLVLPQATPQIAAAASYDFNYVQGTLNSGVITYNGLFNSTQNGSPNQIANPYASAIDAEVFIAENANIDVVYFWEHLSGVTNYPGYNPSNYSMGDISLYSVGALGGIGVAAANGGDAPTQFIASGQGFAYKASSAFPVTFNNSMRVTGPNNTYTRPINRELVWLKVANEQYNLGSSSVIGFSENTTNGLDEGTDVTRLATAVSLYSELETGEQLAINALSQWNDQASVNMSFSSQLDSNEVYTISITNREGIEMEDATIFLVDNQLGTTTNLNEGSYNFQSNAGSFPDRFTILFRDPFLGVNSNTSLTVGLYPNPANSVVTIASPKALINNVTIVDISGRIIENVTVDSQNTYQLNIASLNSAIYFVKITTDNGQITKRLIKN